MTAAAVSPEPRPPPGHVVLQAATQALQVELKLMQQQKIYSSSSDIWPHRPALLAFSS